MFWCAAPATAGTVTFVDDVLRYGPAGGDLLLEVAFYPTGASVPTHVRAQGNEGVVAGSGCSSVPQPTSDNPNVPQASDLLCALDPSEPGSWRQVRYRLNLGPGDDLARVGLFQDFGSKPRGVVFGGAGHDELSSYDRVYGGRGADDLRGHLVYGGPGQTA